MMVWQCCPFGHGSKLMGCYFGICEFTTHLRTYFSWGLGCSLRVRGFDPCPFWSDRVSVELMVQEEQKRSQCCLVVNIDAAMADLTANCPGLTWVSLLINVPFLPGITCYPEQIADGRRLLVLPSFFGKLSDFASSCSDSFASCPCCLAGQFFFFFPNNSVMCEPYAGCPKDCKGTRESLTNFPRVLKMGSPGRCRGD